MAFNGLNISTFIHDFWYRSSDEDVERVEFYINDVLRYTIYTSPFTWTWDDKENGEFFIKIIAYDKEGNSVSCERHVKKL